MLCYNIIIHRHRYSAELKGSEGEQAIEVTDQQREQEKPAPSSHDNYVNYDIAQTVLESMARKHSASEGLLVVLLCVIHTSYNLREVRGLLLCSNSFY